MLPLGAWKPCGPRGCGARRRWRDSAPGALERLDSRGLALSIALGCDLAHSHYCVSARTPSDPGAFESPRHHTGRRSTLHRETLAELTDAVFDLAREHIGALIVLPQRDPLDLYLRGGVPVDALMSREVLRALFQPPAPTHDGAVVLRTQRIDQAACFLPMTTATGLPATYGARHRAALGLTERCDALCLLVSEERGTVALARQENSRCSAILSASVKNWNARPQRRSMRHPA